MRLLNQAASASTAAQNETGRERGELQLQGLTGPWDHSEEGGLSRRKGTKGGRRGRRNSIHLTSRESHSLYCPQGKGLASDKIIQDSSHVNIFAKLFRIEGKPENESRLF